MKKQTTALGEVLKSNSGFPVIKFKDYYESDCSLEMSTIILTVEDEDRLKNPGTSAVWLGKDTEHMHLNRTQVAALIHVLQNWLRTGKFA